MKVLITGAGGGVGSQTVAQLLAAGCDIVAMDKGSRFELPIPLHQVNLLDEAGVTKLCEGVDAVVHLGNYIGAGWGKRTNPLTFNENVAMNMNVFNGALEAGAKKIVFASSIQVIASERNYPADPPHARSVAYLPLDCDSPPNPTNSYALSKLIGERMLADYFAPWGMQCVSLRLSLLFFPGIPPKGYEPFNIDRPPHPPSRAQALGMLSYGDAARAIVAALNTDLPGHRTYLAAQSQITGAMVRPVIERYYPDVPLKRPIEQIDSLIDNRRLQEETGWQPLDALDTVMACA